MRLVGVRLVLAVLGGLGTCQLLAKRAEGQAAPFTQNNSAPRAAQVPVGRPNANPLSPGAANRSANPQTASTLAQPGQPAKPPVLEKADAAQRAAFLKLIGANWIWSPAYAKDDVPVGDCYFRRTFTVKQVELAQVHVVCDNKYELYVNGRLVGQGADWRHMDAHDVTKLLVPGKNVVAIKATNTDAGAAGLVARVLVKEKGSTLESYSSDATWRTSVVGSPGTELEFAL